MGIFSKDKTPKPAAKPKPKSVPKPAAKPVPQPRPPVEQVADPMTKDGRLIVVPPMLTTPHPFGGYDPSPTDLRPTYSPGGEATRDHVIHLHTTRIVDPNIPDGGDGGSGSRLRTWDHLIRNGWVDPDEEGGYWAKPNGPHAGWYGTTMARQMVGDLPFRMPQPVERPELTPTYPLPVVSPSRPWLGIVLQWYEDPNAFGHQMMAVVNKVISGSPAETAGILPNDRIEYWDNTRLEAEETWNQLAQRMKPGQGIDFGIQRPGAPDLRVLVRPVDSDRARGAKNPFEPKWPSLANPYITNY